VLGPYKALIDQLPAERLPRKQLYTARKIYETIKAEGYTGSESGVRNYIARRREQKGPKVSVPLELDPGTDGQVAWSEGVAIIAGEQVTVQLLLMRLCYSRRLFMMAFPAQKQEAFTSTSPWSFGTCPGRQVQGPGTKGSVRASKGTCGRSITFRGCRTASAMIT